MARCHRAKTLHQLIEQIHKNPTLFNLVVTGGGASSIGELLAVPGASNSLINANVPYGEGALSQFLGTEPKSACSESTARQMASQAFFSAKQLSQTEVLGVAATAALKTNRDRRGSDRIHVAIQSSSTTAAYFLELDSEESRAQQERACASFIILCIGHALQIQSSEHPFPMPSRICQAPEAWQDVFVGSKATSSAVEIPAIYPGAFNPPHEGHFFIRQLAEKKLGCPVTFELSISNVDKPPLDYFDMSDRQALLRQEPLVFSRAATFIEKSACFPKTKFVVGVDTLIRIDDKKYYGDSIDACRQAIELLAERGHSFLVFGRLIKDSFQGLDDVTISPRLRSLCESVPESEFRMDLSSTDLRAKERIF